MYVVKCRDFLHVHVLTLVMWKLFEQGRIVGHKRVKRIWYLSPMRAAKVQASLRIRALSRQNLRCSLIQAVSQEEPSDRKPDPWLLWMAGHAQLKFVMTECSKTQIRLTRLEGSNIFRRTRQMLMQTCDCYSCMILLRRVMRKPFYAICEQQRCRSACASSQSDQHICCSLPR